MTTNHNSLDYNFTCKRDVHLGFDFATKKEKKKRKGQMDRQRSYHYLDVGG